MSAQTRRLAKLEDIVRNTQGSEASIPKVDLIGLIEDGENQLEGLYERIRSTEREVLFLKDRIKSQGDVIKKLKAEAVELSSKKRK